MIAHHEKGRLGHWVGCVEQIVAADGQRLWLEHPVHGKEADVVALRLRNLDGVDLYSYGEADWLTDKPQLEVEPADAVSVIGFPFGMTIAGYFPVSS